MNSGTYIARRQALETYFDRTAVEAWAKLTTDAPVSGIRRTVRAGRERMRATLLDWLPADLSGRTLLDAGCGTGALAVEAARRGAKVTAVDLSPKLVAIARERLPRDLGPGSIEFLSGDMLDPALGGFDHVVGMDSLIHYRAPDMVAILDGLAKRTGASLLFTFAPRTPMLSLMHAVGKAFPRSDRAPAIEPVAETSLHRLIGRADTLRGWDIGRGYRVDVGFYKSQAQELKRA